MADGGIPMTTGSDKGKGKSPYQKRVEAIIREVGSRDDLHERYLLKIKDILMHFYVDAVDEFETRREKDIILKDINDFIDGWVVAHFVGDVAGE
jgi:hypothetical protein